MITLEAKNINKYFLEPEKFQVLKDISIQVKRGEFVSLIGKSGCGKSTLLYILSTLDTDYQGQLYINGNLVSGKDQNELANLRNKHIGFVFQFHYLLPEFSCIKNVMIPALRLGEYSYKEIEEKAYEKLKLLGVENQATKLASRLSGGQQQRVSIARALINDPTILFCDEPTGNLDSKNAENVFDIFKTITSKFHQTIVAVTHDNDFAANCDRIIEMLDGEIINQGL